MGKSQFILRLKLARTKSGLTQKEVAQKLNISYTKYNHYETGRNEPDLDTIIQLADFFNVTIDFLLGNDIKINDNAATPSISEEDLALLGEIKTLSPEERKGLELFFDLRKQTNKNQTGSN